MSTKVGEYLSVGMKSDVQALTATVTSGALTSSALILQSPLIYGSTTGYIRIPQGYLARIWSREASLSNTNASGCSVSIQYVPNYASAALNVQTLEILAPYSNTVGTTLVDPRKPLVVPGIDGNGAIQFVLGGALASGLAITTVVEIVDSSSSELLQHFD